MDDGVRSLEELRRQYRDLEQTVVHSVSNSSTDIVTVPDLLTLETELDTFSQEITEVSKSHMRSMV